MVGSIKKWLEDVKAGYGDRFAGAFDEVGVEDISDLGELGGDDAFEELERALQARGAKLVQLQKIRKALVHHATIQRAGPAPSAAVAASSIAGHAALKAMSSPDAAAGRKAEKPTVKHVFGLGLPVMKPKVGHATAPPSPMGYSLMQAGDGPRIYVVHGIDGDHQAAGTAFRRLAALLGACQVVALEYNEEARTCGTLSALAALYNQRIVGSAHGGSAKTMYVAGYSMGCILAHQMALQLQEAGAQVGLLLFGSEVVWPAESCTWRMGGYEWLGGSIEAALHMARHLGGLEFAENEVRALLACRAEERDANKVHMRIYWKFCGPRDIALEEFQSAVSTGARNMDMLRALMWQFEPQRTFEGYTLLVLAPDSPDFFGAREVNSRHCICLKTISVAGTGNHYNMLDVPQASIVADAVLACLREQGEAVGVATPPPPPAMAAAPAAAAPAWAAAAPAAKPAPAARGGASIVPSVTQQDVNKVLVGIINSIAMDPLPMDENLMDSGFDSISMSLLIQQIQTDFKIEVDQSEIMEMPTIADIAKHIRSIMPEAEPSVAASGPAPAPAPPPPAAPALQLSPVAEPPTEAAAVAVPAAAVATPAAAAAEPGLAVLSEGKGPCVYMVHGIDGDIWGIGNSYRALAPLLAPCRCCALACDEEALACASLPALAGVYNRRVLDDSRRQGAGRPVVVMGYSMGCVIAHQMALQFQTSAVSVSLVMVDFEISWPPAPTKLRIGGYNWLGGDIEAALLITRGMGPESQKWAAQEIQELLDQPPRERNVSLLQAKAYQEVASKKKGFRLSDFNTFVSKGSRNMDRLNAMAGSEWTPTGVFTNDALLILAPESPENTEPALKVNGQYCSKMQVVKALGTHYNILSSEKAPAAARAVLGFLHGLGHAVPRSLKVSIKGMECLHDGGDGPRVYMAHGIDANLYGVGQAYRSLAPMLSPCCCFAFDFDQEARACQSLLELADTYAMRAWQDAQFFPDRPIILMGYSMGCVIAHAMALRFQERGVKTSLVLIDFEISWPPEPTEIRIGGYDWLGGEVEAALLVCRSFGREMQMWAGQQTHEYLETPEGGRDPAALISRIGLKIVSVKKGFTLQNFELMTVKGGAAMQRLSEVVGSVTPAGVYHGETLLILAPESPENSEPAKRINAKYCSKMQVVTALGTHYNIIQADKAMAVASRYLSFLRSIGHNIPSVPTLRNNGIEVLRECGDGDPIIYLVHCDGATKGLGGCLESLAEELAPCGCRVVHYDDEMKGIDHPQFLVWMLWYRMRADAQLFAGSSVFIAGHGMGCLLALSMAQLSEKENFPVRLLMLDYLTPQLRQRPEGCEWLGGELEALLLAARASGPAGEPWARRELEALAAAPGEARDAGALRARLLQDLGISWKDSTPADVNSYLDRSAQNLERLHAVTGLREWEENFSGKTLLVLPAEEDAEVSKFAKETLAQRCSSLETATVPGEPGLLVRPARVASAAEPLRNFAVSALGASAQDSLMDLALRDAAEVAEPSADAPRPGPAPKPKT